MKVVGQGIELFMKKGRVAGPVLAGCLVVDIGFGLFSLFGVHGSYVTTYQSVGDGFGIDC